MARKKKKALRAWIPDSIPAWKPGDLVQVKRGVLDPDLPSLPIGGWTGIIKEIDAESQPQMILIAWDARTLEQFPAIYRALLQTQELELTEMWLEAADLEAQDAGSVVIGRPASYIIPPHEGQIERIRNILDEQGDGPLPPVDKTNLLRFHHFLVHNLLLPIPVLFEENPDEKPGVATELTMKQIADEEHCFGRLGILVEVEDEGVTSPLKDLLPLLYLEPIADDEAKELIEDYAYWFYQGEEELPKLALPNFSFLLGYKRSLYQTVGLWSAFYGAVAGGLLATLNDTQIYVTVGAVFFAFLLCVAGLRLGNIVGLMCGSRYGRPIGGAVGLIVGSGLGVVTGAIGAGYAGTLPGGILGSLVGVVLNQFGWRPLPQLSWNLLGAGCGGLTLSLVTNYQQALGGIAIGGFIGMIGMLILWSAISRFVRSLFPG